MKPSIYSLKRQTMQEWGFGAGRKEIPCRSNLGMALP